MVPVDTAFPANGTDCACTEDAATVETPSRARAISVRCIWLLLTNDARAVPAPIVIEMCRTGARRRMPDCAPCFTEAAFRRCPSRARADLAARSRAALRLRLLLAGVPRTVM